MVDIVTPDPNLLVGLQTHDDAGVYKLSDDVALVQTVDYFTPIVDDAYLFGRIAAANALSDIYAMGGKPLTALNIVGYPISKLPPEILAQILQGGADTVREAGAVLMGGHSIDDTDPKYGLAVTGICHPKDIWTNTGAKPGDALVLTKPIGVGVITTAIKQGLTTPEEEREVAEVMATLNRVAAETAKSYTVHACTDVTGFGLLGHTLEMAAGSGVRIQLSLQRVPVLGSAERFALHGAIPGGTKRNLEYVLPRTEFQTGVSGVAQVLLADAITSGGLLLAVPREEVGHLVEDLHNKGVAFARHIGDVLEQTADHGPDVVVTP